MKVNEKTFKEIKNILLKRIKDEELNEFPQTILIDNISYCNLKCSMCPHSNMQRKPGIMDMQLYKKIIDEIALKNRNTRIWITFFGEGLILKDLNDRISYAKSKGLKDIVLNSNGNLLDYDIAKKLILAGLDAIYVGIDAFTSEKYKNIRIGGDLDKVVQGVLEYKKALDEYGKSGQKIFVQFVEMEENFDELNDFIEFWSSNGIEIKVRPKVSWAGKVEAKNLKDEYERLPCNWAMNTLNISDTGEICLCSVDLNCQVSMGNIKNSTIEDIWNSSLKNFRMKHLEKKWDELPQMCYDCKDWQSSYAEYIKK